MSRYASLLPSVLPVAAIILAGCAQTPQSPSTVAAPVLNTSLDPANCSKPVYPPQALARKIEGTSTIQFLLKATSNNPAFGMIEAI